MELWQEIVRHIRPNHGLENQSPDLYRIVEATCYKALEEIKQVLDDDRLDDKECFERIEAIVCIFESMGSNGGSRHDF